ncbi:MAG TPA: NAD(P)-dependent oxidoreductase, partial [Deinococcales bacterium]|nr:NAD(P)-dependent oxidoreductase [Deinococcales bacterium]
MSSLLVPESLPWKLDDLPLEVIRFDPRQPLNERALAADALLVWGAGRDARDLLTRLPNLRWVQTFMAGVDSLLSPDVSEGVLISNGKGLHDIPVAEHTVAMLLEGVRALHLYRDDQDEKRWNNRSQWARAGGPEGGRLETLEDARVIILGFGSIGQAIAERLAPFGCSIVGVATAAGNRAGFPVVTDLDAELPSADVLINVLPHTPGTVRFLDARRFALMPPHAWFVNVGRGSAVDETALDDVLRAGRLGGAALDVFATEPLPQDSPLWTNPRVIVSPHVAGGGPGFPKRALALLAENAR